MSPDVDMETAVEVSTESVSVEKTFCGEEFAVPAIKFEIRSEADDPVAVRLIDYIPTDFPMDSVGFHPDFENTNWTAYKDHRVQFERVLEAGEELTTVYGIRLGDLEEVPSFLGEPELYEVDLEDIEADLPFADSAASAGDDEVEDEDLIDIVSEDSSQVVRDVIAGETETVPGLEPDADEDADAVDPLADDATDPLADGATDPLADAGDDPLAADAADPLADIDADADAEPLGGEADAPAEPDLDPIPDADADEADEDAEEPAVAVDPVDDLDAVDAEGEADLEPDADAGEADDAVAEPPTPTLEVESVGAALATEIREGRVSDADLRILRHELDFDAPESTNVRIRHLQSRVDDLEAYTEALEAFIDENGTAERLLSEYEDEVGTLVDRIEGFETKLGPDAETLDRIDELEAEIDDFDVSEELGDVERRFEELEELVGANTTDTAALAGDVETLEGELESELASVSERLASIDGKLDERLDALDADLSERLDEFDDDLDGRLDSFESDVEAIHEEIEEIQEWRSQLSSVFGAQTEQ